MNSISNCNTRLFGCTLCAPKKCCTSATCSFQRLSWMPNKLGFGSGFVPLIAVVPGTPPYDFQIRRNLSLHMVVSDGPRPQQEEFDMNEEDKDQGRSNGDSIADSSNRPPDSQIADESPSRLSERAARRKAERYTYLFAAVASTVGITSMAAGAVYYRFAWQMQGGEISFTEMFGTFSLAIGAAIGMEAWARWAHRALWHSCLWEMHKSHHRPREGPFEMNDVFAIINAVPAIGLMGFGFFNKGLVPGLCFGAGLGITVFGMAYMFVHDGLVHRRFPVGPIADVPYLQKVAAAHQLHHADKFDGVPYGLFLGPKEVEDVGGLEELQKLLKSRSNKKSKVSAQP